MTVSPVISEISDGALLGLIETHEQLEDLLSRPTAGVIETLSRLEGGLMVLGAGGKMGPCLARMARRAYEAVGIPEKIVAVNRSFAYQTRAAFESQGIQTVQGDLLDPAFLDSLPEVPNVVFMAGRKFGSAGNEPLTWAMNAYLPALVCRKFRASRIVAFSTGNVYGMVPAESAGSAETDSLQPCGEYAMSCLGRERIFEYFSESWNIPVTLIRLNYATEMRYGVLVDLAQKVDREEEIDLTMGYVNVIWQGDAVATALCSLGEAASPASILNVAGPERLSVREVCEQFGRLLGKTPRFRGKEAHEALLNDGSRAHRRYGLPCVSAERMIGWIAHWVAGGNSLFDKPTCYEVRDGVF
jgi:nucleoside-diphosphate-sugar epimerase